MKIVTSALLSTGAERREPVMSEELATTPSPQLRCAACPARLTKLCSYYPIVTPAEPLLVVTRPNPSLGPTFPCTGQ